MYMRSQGVCTTIAMLIVIYLNAHLLTDGKLRGSSIFVLSTRKFRKVIYFSSMSAEMSSAEISASGSFNYKFSGSEHCRATMYYNPSWSPYRDSDDEFLLFSHRRHGGTLCQAGRTLRGFTDARPSPRANQ